MTKEQIAQEAWTQITNAAMGGSILNMRQGQGVAIILVAIEKANTDLLQRMISETGVNLTACREGTLGVKPADSTQNSEIDTQSPLPQPQTWTNVYVEDLWEEGGSIKVKDCHNAALADVEAWRLTCKGKEGAYVKLESALAAERDYRNKLAIELCKEQKAHVDDLKPLVELLEQVLSETVDARAYPNGTCLEAYLRTDIKDALAKMKEGK